MIHAAGIPLFENWLEIGGAALGIHVAWKIHFHIKRTRERG